MSALNPMEMMADLLSSPSEAEMARRMQRFALVLNCEKVLHGIELRPLMQPVIQNITSCYPEEYSALYHNKGFIYRDPSVSHCQTRTDPIFWDEQMYDKSSYEIMEESRRFGLGHGFSIPVRENDRCVSMISLGRDKAFTESELQMVLPTAHVLATSLHMAAQRIVVPTMVTSRRPQLTNRELECLKWVSYGKSNSMIADILNVSDATVAFHLKNALKKLNVATRMQAVALSVSTGLIS